MTKWLLAGRREGRRVGGPGGANQLSRTLWGEGVRLGVARSCVGGRGEAWCLEKA